MGILNDGVSKFQLPLTTSIEDLRSSIIIYRAGNICREILHGNIHYAAPMKLRTSGNELACGVYNVFLP